MTHWLFLLLIGVAFGLGFGFGVRSSSAWWTANYRGHHLCRLCAKDHDKQLHEHIPGWNQEDW